MPSWSVRNRLVIVTLVMTFLASASIGAVYLATERERTALRADLQSVSVLHDLTIDLFGAIRDQEAAIDDYLLSANPDAAVRYRDAMTSELRLVERMRAGTAGHPEIEAALLDLADQTARWQESVGQPAISAVERTSINEIARLGALVASDQTTTLADMATLVREIDAAEALILSRDDALTGTRAMAGGFGIGLMILTAIASLVLTRRWVTQPLGRLLATAREVESGADVVFRAERDDEIGRLGGALERMRAALKEDVDRSTILNRFTEVTTFAVDDTAVAAANLDSLWLLVRPDAAVSHVLNTSKDRAVPEATLGPALAEVLPLNALSRCPAIMRGGIYVTPDASEPLSVRCPVYPVDHGTLACVPLSHGETVGAVHLFWEQAGSFGPELRSSVARLAEHAALAIANRRLLATLKGMASTDPRTGLANTGAFDQQLEDALASRRPDELIAVLMLDLDRFKNFNDRHGHPAGDEALRAFAAVLRSCLRDGDLAARYGGEEFAVALPRVDRDTAFAVAERIRSRTETTVISLAPGISDRISVSIGVAIAPDEATDRIALLRLADEALYKAKAAGRNRVAGTTPHDTDSGTSEIAPRAIAGG